MVQTKNSAERNPLQHLVTRQRHILLISNGDKHPSGGLEKVSLAGLFLSLEMRAGRVFHGSNLDGRMKAVRGAKGNPERIMRRGHVIPMIYCL